ncbi:MAG: hypothetical protein ACO394_13460 [Blastocatellia bacterium]|jgi:hypothetical protein
MSQAQEPKPINPVNLLIDTFWALMPEKTANEVAEVKRMVLGSIRQTVDFVVTKELEWTDRHLENARRMREQYRSSAPANESTAPTGAGQEGV